VSVRQELITQRVSRVLGGTVDTTYTEWATFHGDLHWVNITAPRLSLLDWTDWAPAPRGNDAACSRPGYATEAPAALGELELTDSPMDKIHGARQLVITS
jgi:hypothetical protein